MGVLGSGGAGASLGPSFICRSQHWHKQRPTEAPNKKCPTYGPTDHMQKAVLALVVGLPPSSLSV